MEAIQKVKELEEKGRAEKAEAESRVKQALSEAEREGEALLQKTRRDGVDKNRELMRQAEERAAAAAAEIAKNAEGDSAKLVARAKSRLDEAAEFIVGKVVKS